MDASFALVSPLEAERLLLASPPPDTSFLLVRFRGHLLLQSLFDIDRPLRIAKYKTATPCQNIGNPTEFTILECALLERHNSVQQ
jgi:hypothetical protein